MADISMPVACGARFESAFEHSSFSQVKKFYVLDVEFASVFRLKGEMGVPTYVSPSETTSLNS